MAQKPKATPPQTGVKVLTEEERAELARVEMSRLRSFAALGSVRREIRKLEQQEELADKAVLEAERERDVTIAAIARAHGVDPHSKTERWHIDPGAGTITLAGRSNPNGAPVVEMAEG